MKSQRKHVRSNNARGSALMLVMYMITIMSLVLGVHFYRNSQNAAIEGQIRENEAGAQAVAEYASEMVIANLGNMEFKEQDGVRLSIEKDWVGVRPYGETGLASAERRIAGTVDGYDYRVVVRAVREAKKVEPQDERPDSAWLAAINPEDYEYGTDSIESFTGAYEVIASARKTDSYRSGESLFSPQFAYDSTVRTVVNMDYSSIVGLQSNLAVLSLTGPLKDEVEISLGHSPGGAANLAPRNRAISLESYSPGGGAGGDGDGDGDGDDDDDDDDEPFVPDNSGAQGDGFPAIENVLVSGEDHYSHKAAVKDKNDDGTIATWDVIRANASELFSVTNDYWDKGKMTLHYRFGEEWNPRIPRTINFDTYMNGRTTCPITGNSIAKSLNQDTVYRFQFKEADKPATERSIVDQYIYGGKVGSYEYENLNPLTNSAIKYRRGRSVTLDGDYRIIEKEEAEADPDAIASDGRGMTTTTLAVSKYENIFNLYFTLVQTASAHSHPVDTATDHQIQTWIDNNWNFQSLGYFSKAKSKIMTPQITRAIRPLDNYYSPERRRWATLVWIKNGDAQFLVREYPADANYENPLSSVASPTGTWYGTYRWAWYVGYNGTYKYHMGTWLETVEGQGVSSGKNYSKNINTRFLTLEELLGCEVVTGSDDLPAAYDKDGKLIGGVPDFKLDSTGNRIPYDPDGTGTVFNEKYQRQNQNGDNFGINESIMANPSLVPPTDGIYVRVEESEITAEDLAEPGRIWQGGPKNYKYRRYKTIQDFNHLRNVADPEKNEEDDWRNITSLHMVLEITPEDPPTAATAAQDYGTLYFDMGLTLAVVYPREKEPNDDEYFLEDIFRQWWQGESQESLTGEISQRPVYAIVKKPSEADLEGLPGEMLEEKFYYRQFGFVQPRDGETIEGNMENGAPNVYSMLDKDDNPVGIGLAKFFDEGDDMGKLDPEAWGQPGDEFLFHYGQDILYEYYGFDITEYYASRFVEEIGEEAFEQLAQNPDKYYARLDEWRENKALEAMWAANKDWDEGIQFVRLDKRFDDNKRFQAQLTVDKVLSLLRIPKTDITTRYFYSQLFGFRNAQTRVVQVKLNDEDGSLEFVNTDSETGAPVVTSRTLTYMATDRSPDMDEWDYIKPLYRPGSQQPNGWPLDPKILWNHGTLARIESSGLSAEEITRLKEDGYTEDLDTVYYYPDWFLSENDFNDINLKEPLKEEYPREHRGRIGWHREGPYDKVHVPNSTELTERQYRLTYGDHYEFTIMAEQGFVPYETVMVYPMDGEAFECVALFYTPDTSTDGGGDVPMDVESEELWQPRLKAPAKMPTFVIRNDVEGKGNDDEIMGELDGAGILVVNGNLRVKTRLAYHGTIVVLGDVIVGAEEEDDMVISRDKYGQIVDSKDNVLELNGGQWGYYTGKDGNEWVLSEPGKHFLGDLIVQGMLIVGGDVICLNEKAINQGGTIVPAGTIDLRGSKRAISETTGTWAKAAPYEGLQVDRIGWSAGVNTADMNLWKD